MIDDGQPYNPPLRDDPDLTLPLEQKEIGDTEQKSIQSSVRESGTYRFPGIILDPACIQKVFFS